MTGITVRHIEGRLLAVKRATDAGRERLDHEREILTRIDHPGVVQLVDIDHEDFSDAIATRFVGPDNWDARPPTSPAEIVTGTAKLAGTLSDLHDLGLSHGAVRPEHVVIAADGRPVLCGLADAVAADEASRRADLKALGDLVADLADHAPRSLGRDLTSIAVRCRDGSIDGAAAARLLDGLDPTEQLHPRRPSARTTVSGAVAVVGFALLLWLVLAGDPRPPAEAASTSPTTAPTEVDQPVPTPTTPPTTPPPPPTNPPTSASATSPPTTGPSTPSPAPTTTATTTTTGPQSGPTATGDPPEVEHDGRRYRVGDPGDVVVVGDWDCNGTATPAVLRPSTGEVAAFDTWPSPGADVSPTWVEVVDAADQVEVETVDGCDRVRVRAENSSRLVGPAQ